MGIKAKKSLGQNFLKSKEALLAIINAGKIQSSDLILEIGPGKGALTTMLITLAGKVIAIEKDTRLIPELNEQFADAIQTNKLEIIEQDILDFDPSLLKNYSQLNRYKIIANIPYYITGILFRKFLTADYQPQHMVVLVQKEVAKRIVAKEGKESLLSISVKAYGTPRYVLTVKAKYFSPAPKVDSAIISIEQISKDFFNNFSEETFFDIVRTGFAHPRKKAVGNLKAKIPNIKALFEQLAINIDTRPEDLTLEQWKAIMLTMDQPAMSVN